MRTSFSAGRACIKSCGSKRTPCGVHPGAGAAFSSGAPFGEACFLQIAKRIRFRECGVGRDVLWVQSNDWPGEQQQSQQ